MPHYEVSIPFTGVAYLYVDADDEVDAVRLAHDLVDLQVLDGKKHAVLGEWQTHDVIVQGNVFYGVQNIAEAMKVEEE